MSNPVNQIKSFGLMRDRAGSLHLWHVSGQGCFKRYYGEMDRRFDPSKPAVMVVMRAQMVNLASVTRR